MVSFELHHHDDWTAPLDSQAVFMRGHASPGLTGATNYDRTGLEAVPIVTKVRYIFIGVSLSISDFCCGSDGHGSRLGSLAKTCRSFSRKASPQGALLAAFAMVSTPHD
jgi:hypothetical protein